ncbi:anthranilate synthase component I [Streptomyces sp. NK08204]|uniref:anthranilate synthase component I n=1 Tax=Streptomyces sp. NK08204 TaxID=2873260 RepID=UPI001CECE0DC|nr:anthranilate synthase component I [Streptomyces sp. NK08204]
MTGNAVGVLPEEWVTDGGVLVERRRVALDAEIAAHRLETALDQRRGALFTSDYEYPGRYRRRGVGYTDPPVEIVLRGLTRVEVRALNARGEVLLPVLRRAAEKTLDGVAPLTDGEHPGLAGTIGDAPGQDLLSEEDRTRRRNAFDFLRAVQDAFAGSPDPHLGLYGAFGYDLVLAFDPVPLKQRRDEHDRDLVVHIPDSVTVLDPVAGTAFRYDYEFEVEGSGTAGLDRRTPPAPFTGPASGAPGADHAPGEYAELVRTARERFRVGDLFEVVPSRTFRRPCNTAPSELFRTLRGRNPSPYQMLMNLGEGEFLVGTSPEMFVRVHPQEGAGGRRWRVESCPISGTAARGRDALEDAQRIRALLGSEKEESELTMCTDVDRNDKARVCEPGSVRIIGRRQLEMYSTLIHTVDHVEGILQPGRDALDAFLTHMWAVTVTGAPKRAAIAFIEEHERSPRRWYGGAVGRIGFDGTLDTGLTIRTVQIRDGQAVVRTGATLLHDSDPAAEERETELKALAPLDALERPASRTSRATGFGLTAPLASARPDVRVLLVDHQDSFVHTLASYFRHAGAQVSTYRSGFDEDLVDALDPDLLVLSPGPGRPSDFDTARTLRMAEERHIPVFGVCLGLQAIVEYLGGELDVLERPFHGKPSTMHVRGDGGTVLAGLPERVTVGRYHSLYANRAALPADLRVTAETADGVAMAVEHRSRPLAAVQFHPESLMTQFDDHGLAVINNVVAGFARRPRLARV